MKYLRLTLLLTALVISAVGIITILIGKKRNTKFNGIWVLCIGMFVFMTFIAYSNRSLTEEMIQEEIKNIIGV